MLIPTKYKIGQQLYYVRRKDTQILESCPSCKGSKKIQIDNYGETDCPNCQNRTDGKKVIKIDSEWIVSGTMVPNCLNIQILESPDYFEGIRVSIRYSGLSDFGEHHLFVTKKEAEEWCIEANKNPMGDDLFHGKEKLYTLEKLI